ncbi:MAG: hypothetical protein ACLQIB_11515 [Isosphaeraceae bacterium]
MTTARINGCLVRITMVAAILVVEQTVSAQEDAGDLGDDAPIAFTPRPRRDEPWFLRTVLGGPTSIETAREILEFRLQRQLEETDRECRLAPDQKKKLELAGRGDIKHFLDRINEVRTQFLAVERDRNEVSVLLRESRSFRSALTTGVFGEGSLFAKTFARVIGPQQAADAARFRLEREMARYRDAVAETVAMLSRSLSLTTEQRRRFVSVLTAETRPPEQSGDSRVAYVMFQAARMPRSKLEPIFDDDQRRLLWKLLKSYENIEEFLKDDGFVFDAPPLARHSLWAPGNEFKARFPRDKASWQRGTTLEKMLSA